MQCSLKYDLKSKKWKSSALKKIPEEAGKIFEKLLEEKHDKIFNGKIPPFFESKITHEEWKKIKEDTDDFNDQYIECPDYKILKLYKSKGCKYIQISEKGLYHLGSDICNFNVPEFTPLKI